MAQNISVDLKDDASAVVPMVPEMVSIKHPLERPWSIWYNSNDKKNWEDCLIELTTFDTVEDYWCLYHHMLLPSELRQGQDYAVFKQGVRPMWEDSNNVSGGRWVIMAENLHHLNAIWLDIVLLLIGENFENMDMISGVIVNVRFRSKVVIWTTNKSREENIKIAKKVKNTIAIRRKFDFQAHNASKILFSL
ncbi:eukaryotic translation initiation factor 4E1-like [Galleria mellonella]|uniref:eIF-4F 25 kDa subunit n=1 Tax=Galleria mellonella TaxID=7137 RepID=A0ABM3MG57_GALME|nr:eukaryotic translation initiation factor 4E1-like [Galleria mellonella]